MDGIKIDDVIFPKVLVMNDGNFEGYIMDNFKNSINLYNFLLFSRYINCKDILKNLKKASLILREIHKNEIICQDLSLDNILIDKNGNIKYSDTDSWCYKDHTTSFISKSLSNLITEYRKENRMIRSDNLDRISFMISFYNIMYINEIQNLNRRKYNKLANHINTLNNTRKYANMLVDKNNPIPEIPYLDELIDDNDDYIIDRFYQLPLKEKIKKIVF